MVEGHDGALDPAKEEPQRTVTIGGNTSGSLLMNGATRIANAQVEITEPAQDEFSSAPAAVRHRVDRLGRVFVSSGAGKLDASA
jgi:hypothetical protein